MARRAQGWRLTLDARTGVYGVRWRTGGTRRHYTTGERDPGKAAEAAERIYAKAVSGRRTPPRAVASGRRVRVIEAVAEWLGDSDSLDEETAKKYEQYGRAWGAFFVHLDEVTGPAIEDFWRARLRVVKRKTVIKQLYAINVFLRWCRGRSFIDEVPTWEPPAKSATGTPAKGRRQIETVQLSDQEARAIIAKLPELSEKRLRGRGDRWRVRDRFLIAWETALRPATIEGLRVPEDYRRGARVLRIRDEIDKSRFGREVPLTKRARAALDRCAPDIGEIFPRITSNTSSKYLREAAAAAGIDSHRATALKAYDLRHARLTYLAEHGDNLVGVAFLAGHKAQTTTNRYVHAHQRAAASVLSAIERPKRRR